MVNSPKAFFNMCYAGGSLFASSGWRDVCMCQCVHAQGREACVCGVCVCKGGGAGGGHGPRAQALEGALGQPVGASFKKKIRPRQISKVTSLQCPGLT